MASPYTVVEVAGREVKVTNPGKVYFPARGETKLDLVQHYLLVGEGALRGVFRRPDRDEALPRRCHRRDVLPEAGAGQAAGLAADRRRSRSRVAAPPRSCAPPTSPI